ncbi:ABC transporter ATP-binding protein [Azospirillum sp. TSH64]|uniref:ABC transporter ATP-binding protein n=1 Tax=Azospirillum sp. TSH64 TaxID=652740 RepID=UPI000D606773|nr:ABC transporter ATP-binding protein [Azospirillum sp. TSH64]PWC75848.1 ABC transporter ATP-binding protein [Azospirillum sp. TSH64]
MSVVVDSLAFRYPAAGAGLDGVSLDVVPGEFCAVIGPSGCGKSTLLKLIAGFLSPAAGQIRIAGTDMTGVPTRLRNLGIVFQNYALFPHMTALENVAYPLKLRGVGRAERLRRAGQALERTRLSGLADRHPRQLSGGQQQRVALARALVFAPGALLLDEPLSALDAAHRAAMRDEIRAVQREHGIATLHVTHDQEEALSIADKVAVMRDGALLQLASPQELYDRPADRFVAGFVGHANLFDGTVRGPDLVETAIGPLACATGGQPAGTSVTLLARPEAVRTDPPDDAVNRFAGTLVRDRFLGSLRRYDLAVPGGTILGETLSRADIRSVQIPPECLRILPA